MIPTIVDLSDGGFRLKANPKGFQVRVVRTLRWGTTVLVAAAVALSAYISFRYPDPSQMGALAGLIAFFVGGWLVCFVILSPPWVKVTPEKVWVWGDYGGRLRQGIRRSEVASIYRGQAQIFKSRRWGPCYFLVTHDGTPEVTIPAADFTDDGMTELAKRLQVPIQGDFSVEVP